MQLEKKIHINHKLIRNQCINNIRKNNLGTLSTSFVFNDVRYNIISFIDSIEQFQKILLSDNPIEFKYELPNILLIQL